MAALVTWLASSALASTMTSAAKALTRRSWKRAVRSMLDVYCESYAWDEESEQNDLSVVLRLALGGGRLHVWENSLLHLSRSEHGHGALHKAVAY